jgi:hypothetical protein
MVETNMNPNNKTSWQGIKAICQIILKKIALTWVIILVATILIDLAVYLSTVKYGNTSLLQVNKGFYAISILFSGLLGYVLVGSINSSFGGDEKHGMVKLSLYPISSFALVNLVFLLDIVLVCGYFLLSNCLGLIFVDNSLLLTSLLASITISIFLLGFVFFNVLAWIVINFIFSNIIDLVLYLIKSEHIGMYVHFICYLLFAYLLFQIKFYLTRQNWRLKDWFRNLISLQKYINKLSSLSFLKKIRYPLNPGNLLLAYWRLSYLYWCILLVVIIIIAITQTNWLFWGLGGIWLAVGILTRPYIIKRKSIDQSLFFMPLSNHQISRVLITAYFMKAFTVIMSLVVFYLAMGISYGFTFINDAVWLIMTNPAEIFVLSFLVALLLLFKLEKILPLYISNKPVRYLLYVAHIILSFMAYFDYISNSESSITPWLAYFWMIYIFTVLLVSIICFIYNSYVTNCLDTRDVLEAGVIGLGLTASLIVIDLLCQGNKPPLHNIIFILQIILVELIILSAAFIPLEVRLKRNRD